MFIAYDRDLHKYYAIRISKPISRKISYIEPIDTDNLSYGSRDLFKRRRSELAQTLKTRKFSDIGHAPGLPFHCKKDMTKMEQKRSLCQTRTVWGHNTLRRKSHQFFNTTSSEKSLAKNNDNVYCAYAEYVLDYLRSIGIRGKLVLHVTAKNGQDDHSYISSDGKFARFTYHGEAIFYGILRQSTWQFGLKDVGLATVANLINYTTNSNNNKGDIAERFVKDHKLCNPRKQAVGII